MADKLLYTVQDFRKKRVIIDTDAACEADDPFAIAHALMSRMLDVRAVCAEHGAKLRHDTASDESYAH